MALDLRPPAVNIEFRPGNALSVDVEFDTDLTGRTFTWTAGALTGAGVVVGSTVTVSMTEAQTATVTAHRDWVLTETTGGTTEDVIVGGLFPSTAGRGGSGSSSVTVISGAATVVVTTTGGLVGHLADTVGAHSASAVSFTPTGTVAATTVQAAVAELAADAAVTYRPFNPVDYGAVLDGVTDDTAAWQAAIAAAKSAAALGYGATVVFPAGASKVTGLVIENVQGLRLIGAGHQSKFVWAGNSSTALLHLRNVRDCEIAWFRIDTSVTLDKAIHVERTISSGVTTATLNHFHHVWMQGGAGNINIGVQIGATVDANNDFNQFDLVSIRNYAVAGFRITGTQSYGNLMRNCHLHAYTTTAYGVWRSNGYYTWEGGFTGNNAVDFFHDSHALQAATLIRGVVCEGSKRFVESSYVSQGNERFHIELCRWAANAPHADMKAIKIRTATHVLVEDCTLGSANDALAEGPIIEVTAAQSFTFNRNTLFWRTGTGLWDPFTGLDPTWGRGNQRVAEGPVTFVALPDYGA